MSSLRKTSLIIGILLIVMVILPIFQNVNYFAMAYTNNMPLIFLGINQFAMRVFNLIFAVPYIIVMIMAFVGKRTMAIPVLLLVSGIVSAVCPFVVSLRTPQIIGYQSISYFIMLAATVFITLFCAINMMMVLSKQRYNRALGLNPAYWIFTLVFIIAFAVIAFAYNIWRLTGGLNNFSFFEYPMIMSSLPGYIVSIAFAVIWAFVMMLLVKWYGTPEAVLMQQGYPGQGYPQQGYPQQGYPQQGYPQQGYPQPIQAMPQGEDPRQAMYTQGINLLNAAVSEADYRRAQNIFFQLGDYRDSQEKKLYCKQRADELAQY